MIPHQITGHEPTRDFAAPRVATIKRTDISHHQLCKELTSERLCRDQQTTKHEGASPQGCETAIDLSPCREGVISQTARSVAKTNAQLNRNSILRH